MVKRRGEALARMDLLCLNCDRPLPQERPLFCSEPCAEFARVIRYQRRVLIDGRDSDPETAAALSVRMAYALWGQAPGRSLSPITRAEVFATKGDRCLACGAAATDVDHIESAAFGDDSVANLQPLCRTCHLEKTLASPMPWDTRSPNALEARRHREEEFWTRVRSHPPKRECDDEAQWPLTWQAVRAERIGHRLDADLASLLEGVAGHISAGSTVDKAVNAAVASITSRQRRRRIVRRLIELVGHVPD